MKWFGEDWGAPVCKTTEHVHVPEGEKCSVCPRLIAATDQGIILPVIGHPHVSEITYHLKCFLAELGLG